MSVRGALGAGLAAGAAWSVPALAPIVPPVAGALRVPLRRPGAAGVALTFDDGPHPQGTPATLEILAAAGAHATFFLVGEQVRAHPALAAEIVAAGHTVAIHGDRHRNLLRLTPRGLAEDLDRAAVTIAETTGAAATLHRPPYGIYSYTGLAFVRRRGWRPLLWSRWGRDWSARETAQTITDRLTRDLRAGDVLLLHDADWYSDPGSWRATVAALPRVLERIGEAGLTVD
jgi:peptidoglycan/xylan/chitin deacetylase (PgdA/CDA1 family)